MWGVGVGGGLCCVRGLGPPPPPPAPHCAAVAAAWRAQALTRRWRRRAQASLLHVPWTRSPPAASSGGAGGPARAHGGLGGVAGDGSEPTTPADLESRNVRVLELAVRVAIEQKFRAGGGREAWVNNVGWRRRARAARARKAG